MPAAGLGKRFRPLSEVVPKELLLLGDRPVLHHALDEAAGSGFAAALVVLAPWKRPLVERYLHVAGAPLPVAVVEQPEAAGIGDAVLRAAPIAGDGFGILLPDDVVLGREHWAALRSDESTPGLCFRTVPPGETHRFGIGRVRLGMVQELVEKPPPGTAPSQLAIFGRYWATAAVVEALLRRAAAGELGELELTYGFASLAAQGSPVRAVMFAAEIFDCGTPEAYLESQARWYARPR
ncbi:MAG TPA: sugar phosphate nucleotidyltransferase [Candidatus Dormibacteraeota bacterium]